MYAVSAEYINQLKSPIQERRLTGTIGNKTFTSDDVLAGSFSITGKCMDKKELKYGSVEITTLSITLFNSFALTIPRASYKGLVITPSVSLKVGNTWESVPCGVFTVEEATWTEIGVALTAYDNMAKFDKPLSLSATYGTAYDLLSLACTACGVTLGSTRAQIEALPNGTASFSVYPENDMETWRDMVYWVAQTLGGFATCNRQGYLVIRQLGNDTGITLGTTHRFTGMKMSDYITSYTGLSVVNMWDDTTVYLGAQVDNGSTMNLGSNPLLQDQSVRQERMQNILTELLSLEYTPFSCKLIGDMAFDLGDIIHFDGGIASADDCCIMAYSYTFGKEYSAQGFGDNPALANGRSKVDKDLAGLRSKTNQNILEMKMFVNAQEINLANNVEQTVISIRFTTVNDTSVSILHEIQLDCGSDDMEVEATYHLNTDELTYHPKENWKTDGKHLLTLMYFLAVEGDKVYDWTVSLKVTGGTATIARDNARACLSGQGLVATSKWDGRIDIDEEIEMLNIPDNVISLLPVREGLTVVAQAPQGCAVTDSIGLFNVDATAPAMMGMADGVSFKRYVSSMTWNDVAQYTWDVLAENFVWGDD